MNEKIFKVDRFTFKISKDPSVDALCAIEVMVYFMGEPCCDDSGHQYRLYLPAGMKDSSVTDMCQAFAKAVHCDQHMLVA